LKKLLARLVRQSPAMIVAMLALFVALTGTAVATTSALITGKQIKNNSITGADIKNKSIAVGDLATKARGARGARGIAGPVGAQGPQGPAGPAGAPNPNADKLDGLDANQLVRATTVSTAASVNDFDACAFTTVLTRNVNAPVAGILLVTGNLMATRDITDPDPADVAIRVAVGATVATVPQATGLLTDDGNREAGVSATGAIAVGAGTHAVNLQASECEAGLAFLSDRSITTLFVPFGNDGTGTLAVPTAAASAANANR
jgi:hypothetical protein